jgi:hypothetical protein
MVAAYNLMSRSQCYLLVVTGHFSGMANQNFIKECSVFDCDKLFSDRKARG